MSIKQCTIEADGNFISLAGIWSSNKVLDFQPEVTHFRTKWKAIPYNNFHSCARLLNNNLESLQLHKKICTERGILQLNNKLVSAL